MTWKFFKKHKRYGVEVEPDEIFLDSRNLPKFDRQQFEGQLEHPISKSAVMILGSFFLVVGTLFLWQLSVLQISKGQAYYEKSENNSLDKTPLFASRGVIYDRDGVELAWNKENTIGESFLMRAYIQNPGFSHLLGYVSYPSKDKYGKYWQKEFIGKDGIEKVYDEKLKGNNGTQILETNALGQVQSSNIIEPAGNGDNVILSIDSKIQTQLHEYLKNVADRGGYKGGAGVIMDIHTGEILALTNYPEYNSEILSLGADRETINGYFQDKRKVFMNRAVMGLYTPGSIVKPFVAMGALNEDIITPNKVIYTSGSLSIPNPYDVTKKTVFMDWKNHGAVDMRKAIAVSSDVYFYQIGGGFGDQKGLGIKDIEKYSRMFGIGEKTGIELLGENAGVIPTQEWKAKNFNGERWTVGNTYHTSIGQYGFQVTPLEMVRSIAAIANDGTLVKPHLLKDFEVKDSDIKKVDLPLEDFKVVKEGMRMTVTEGTAMALNSPAVKVAAKTGTAQVGISKRFVNAWVVGFFPYDNPKYAFTVLMENGLANNTVKAPEVMKQLFEWMALYSNNYLQ